jgi:hypothetical protein
MAIEGCSRCDRFVDLDRRAEDIEYINDIPVCVDCLTEEEWDKIETDK